MKSPISDGTLCSRHSDPRYRCCVDSCSNILDCWGEIGIDLETGVCIDHLDVDASTGPQCSPSRKI